MAKNAKAETETIVPPAKPTPTTILKVGDRTIEFKFTRKTLDDLQSTVSQVVNPDAPAKFITWRMIIAWNGQNSVVLHWSAWHGLQQTEPGITLEGTRDLIDAYLEIALDDGSRMEALIDAVNLAIYRANGIDFFRTREHLEYTAREAERLKEVAEKKELEDLKQEVERLKREKAKKELLKEKSEILTPSTS